MREVVPRRRRQRLRHLRGLRRRLRRERAGAGRLLARSLPVIRDELQPRCRGRTRGRPRVTASPASGCSATLPAMERLTDIDAAWNESGHGAKLRAVKKAGERLRERFAAGPRCISVRTIPLSTVAYPTRYAFWAAAIAPIPFVTMFHRCLLVQFLEKGELKNLLFNPTDIEGARAVPFYARLVDEMGERVAELMAKRSEPLETQLGRLGIAPEDIDYV